jgi:L-amino acid N-acyltransferase YncA
MSNMYYYTQSGFASDKVIGPISANALAQLYYKKELTAKNPVQKSGTQDWVELADVVEVMEIYHQAIARRNATREAEERKSNELQAVALEQARLQEQAERERQDEANQIQAQRLAYEQQLAAAENLARKTAFRSAMQDAGTSDKHFKLVWVAETLGKKPLYARVESVLQQYGARGWNFEHMHETVWSREESRKMQVPAPQCCNSKRTVSQRYQVTINENVMVLVFSVPAELAESFSDII